MTDGRLLLYETQCCLWQKIAIAKDYLLTDHLYVCHCLKWPYNKKMVVDCILVIKAIGKPFFSRPDLYCEEKGIIGSALFCTDDTGSGFCLAWGKKTYVGKSAV